VTFAGKINRRFVYFENRENNIQYIHSGVQAAGKYSTTYCSMVLQLIWCMVYGEKGANQ